VLLDAGEVIVQIEDDVKGQATTVMDIHRSEESINPQSETTGLKIN